MTRPTLWCRLGIHHWKIQDATALILGPPYRERCTWCGTWTVR